MEGNAPVYLLEQVLEGGFIQHRSPARPLRGGLAVPGAAAAHGRLLLVQPVPVAEIEPGGDEEPKITPRFCV